MKRCKKTDITVKRKILDTQGISIKLYAYRFASAKIIVLGRPMVSFLWVFYYPEQRKTKS